MKRLILCLLAVLMLLGTASSCKNDPITPPDSGTEGSGTESESESGTDTEPAEPALGLVQNGKSDYTIVFARSLMSSTDVSVAVEALRTRVKTDHGVELPVYNDAVWQGSADKPLILVGDTSLADTSDLKASMREGKYWVGVRGQNILLYGEKPEAVVKALSYFTNKIISPQWKDKGNLRVALSLAHWGLGDFTMDTITCGGAELRDFQIVEPANATISEDYAAHDIRCYFAYQYGYALKLVRDTDARQTHEIVITKSTDSTKYTVSIAEGKITVAADGMFGFDSAWNYLRDTVFPAAKTEEEGVYRLPDTLTHTGDAMESADDASSVPLDGDERVMFYNVAGHNPRIETATRLRLQLEIFRTYRPGVLGFQEFHPISHSNGFESGLAGLGYVAAPFVLPKENTRGNNYTPLYYLASRYVCLDSGYRLYKGRNDACSKGLTWAVLENKETGKRFAVITTHYWWEWNDSQDTVVRQNNSLELYDTTMQIREKYPDIAVIAGGDLNHDYVEAEGNPVYLLEQKGFSHAFKVAKRKDDRAARIGYPQVFDETYLAYTSWKMPGNTYFAGRAIDHALVMGNVTVNNYHRILDRYALLSSDHAPHFVDVTLP